MASADTTTDRKLCWRQNLDRAQLAQANLYTPHRRVAHSSHAAQTGKRSYRCSRIRAPAWQTRSLVLLHRPRQAFVPIADAATRPSETPSSGVGPRRLQSALSRLLHQELLETLRRVCDRALRLVVRLRCAGLARHEPPPALRRSRGVSFLRRASLQFPRLRSQRPPTRAGKGRARDRGPCPTTHRRHVPARAHVASGP